MYSALFSLFNCIVSIHYVLWNFQSMAVFWFVSLGGFWFLLGFSLIWMHVVGCFSRCVAFALLVVSWLASCGGFFVGCVRDPFNLCIPTQRSMKSFSADQKKSSGYIMYSFPYPIHCECIQLISHVYIFVSCFFVHVFCLIKFPDILFCVVYRSNPIWTCSCFFPKKIEFEFTVKVIH